MAHKHIYFVLRQQCPDSRSIHRNLVNLFNPTQVLEYVTDDATLTNACTHASNNQKEYKPWFACSVLRCSAHVPVILDQQELSAAVPFAQPAIIGLAGYTHIQH